MYLYLYERLDVAERSIIDLSQSIEASGKPLGQWNAEDALAKLERIERLANDLAKSIAKSDTFKDLP